MGNVLHVELPVGLDEQQMQAISSTPDLRKRQPVGVECCRDYTTQLTFAQVLAASPPEQLPPLTVFSAAVSHLWSIWECLVLSEPILVFGTSPTMTSQAIWWLRDFMRPVSTQALSRNVNSEKLRCHWRVTFDRISPSTTRITQLSSTRMPLKPVYC